MRAVTVAYVPAIHEGYIRFLKEHNNPLYIIGESVLKDLERQKPYYGRDVRALDEGVVLPALRALNIVPSVTVLDQAAVEDLKEKGGEIVMPDEDISRDVGERYFAGEKVIYVNTFLRWNRKISDEEFIVPKGRVVSRNPDDQKIIQELEILAKKSSDWWRQIAAAAVTEGRVIAAAYNRHLPHDQNPNILGDPRSNYDYQEKPAGYTSLHAEADVVAQMAKAGKSLDGAAMYVTTFPCDACARLIIRAGVKKIYYKEGFSRLDSEELLRDAGVDIVLVDVGKDGK